MQTCYFGLTPGPIKAFKTVDFNYVNIFNKIPYLTSGKTVREKNNNIWLCLFDRIILQVTFATSTQLRPITPLSLLFSDDMKLKRTGNVYAANGVQHIKQITQLRVCFKRGVSPPAEPGCNLIPSFPRQRRLPLCRKPQPQSNIFIKEE